MTGEVFLIVRILVAVVLYAFLGSALYLLWQELRQQTRQVGPEALPPLQLCWQVEDQERCYEAAQPEALLGRDPACECVIPDDTVSSRHARLSYHHNQWWIEDLHSTNGTWINEQELAAATVLVDQDLIRCGAVTIRVNIQSPRP